jgi:hypothetical protein
LKKQNAIMKAEGSIASPMASFAKVNNLSLLLLRYEQVETLLKFLLCNHIVEQLEFIILLLPDILHPIKMARKANTEGNKEAVADELRKRDTDSTPKNSTPLLILCKFMCTMGETTHA